MKLIQVKHPKLKSNETFLINPAAVASVRTSYLANVTVDLVGGSEIMVGSAGSVTEAKQVAVDLAETFEKASRHDYHRS